MSGDLEVLKEIPGYKAILKSVLKSQIQMLVEQLSEHTGEETILLTASLHDGTLSHQGSSTGKGFLEGRDEIKSQFLGYCLKSHHKKKSTDTRPSPYQRPQTSGRISPALGSPSKKAPRLQVQPVSLQRVVPSDNTGTPNSNKRPPDVHGAPSQVFTSDSSAEQSSVSVKLESNESGVSSGDSENLTTTTTFPSSIHQNHTLTAGDINTSENNDSQNNTDNYTEISSMNDDSSTANTCIKIEPITENEMELEITGVEPGKVSMQSDSWSHSPSGFGITPTSVVEASSFSNETNDSSYKSKFYPVVLIVDPSNSAFSQNSVCTGNKASHSDTTVSNAPRGKNSGQTVPNVDHSVDDSEQTYDVQYEKMSGADLVNYEEMTSTDDDNSEKFGRHVLNQNRAQGKKHQCPICFNRYSSKYSLKKHLKTHDTVRLRPFKCPKCEKAFHRNDALTAHQRTHWVKKIP